MAAGDSDHPASREALERLCGVYWPSVYSYIRYRGHDAEDARDLAQEFFTRLLDKHYLKAVQRDRGRFRTFLLTAVKHFLANERDRNTAQKRGGGQPLVSLDLDDAEDRCNIDPASAATPESLFEKRWALTLLELVLERLRNEMTEAGQAERFEAFQPYLVADAGPGYKELAGRLGISVGAVKVTVHRMRKRYGALLREEVTQTVKDAQRDQIDAEIRYLLTIVSS